MSHDFLANSVAVHLLDPFVPEGTTMVVCAPTMMRVNYIFDNVLKQIDGVEIQRRTTNQLKVNDKTVLFCGIQSLVRGMNPDYLFLDSVDEYTEEQYACVAPMKYNSIVIESHGTRRSKEDQDVD